jgi:hypothetical protein
LTEAKPLFHLIEMSTYYVVFIWEKPRIYMTWHECSQPVLGYKNAIYKKYSNYDHAVRDFTASLVPPTAPPIDLQDGCQLLPPLLMVSIVLGRMWPLSAFWCLYVVFG